MKINLENQLYKLDNIINKKTPRDLNFIYAMIFFVIIGFSYLTLFDTSEASYNAEHIQVQTLQNKLNNDNTYLRFNTEATLAQLSKQIENSKHQYELYQTYNAYIKYQIEQISSLFYNEKTWGQYINSISENAKKYNISIINFTNKYAPKSTTFGHVLDIHVEVDGSYKNTLKFINAIEQSFLVVDLHDLTIHADKKLYSDLNISVWGIKQ